MFKIFDLIRYFNSLNYDTLNCLYPTAIASLLIIPFVLFIIKPFGLRVPVYLIVPILGLCVIPGGIAFPMALRCWLEKLI